MNNTTISNKRHISSELRFKRLFEMVELKLNKIPDENLQLVNSLNRSVKHPLNRKDSHVTIFSF